MCSQLITEIDLKFITITNNDHIIAQPYYHLVKVADSDSHRAAKLHSSDLMCII